MDSGDIATITLRLPYVSITHHEDFELHGYLDVCVPLEERDIDNDGHVARSE